MPIILGKGGRRSSRRKIQKLYTHLYYVSLCSIEQVKTRMLEYLSVLKVKKDAKAPIICFVGPVSL